MKIDKKFTMCVISAYTGSDDSKYEIMDGRDTVVPVNPFSEGYTLLDVYGSDDLSEVNELIEAIKKNEDILSNEDLIISDIINNMIEKNQGDVTLVTVHLIENGKVQLILSLNI